MHARRICGAYALSRWIPFQARIEKASGADYAEESEFFPNCDLRQRNHLFQPAIRIKLKAAGQVKLRWD